MFNGLKRFFESIEQSEDDKKAYDTREANLAAVALMIAVSNADHQVDQSEVKKILAIASESITLDDEDVSAFFNEAECRADNSISLYEFTKAINAVYDKVMKTRLVGYLWAVAYADGVLDRYEDSTIRKISELIYVSHADFIKAKLAASKPH